MNLLSISHFVCAHGNDECICHDLNTSISVQQQVHDRIFATSSVHKADASAGV